MLFKANAADPDPAPDGNYDQLFIETAEYDDGFAKIVHAAQPHSRNLLVEESDGDHPVKDVGLRLGWDDEQILIWYMRQMSDRSDRDATRTSGWMRRWACLATPSTCAISANPANPFESLNSVSTKQDLAIPNPPGEPVPFAPSRAACSSCPTRSIPPSWTATRAKNYWLPMYFASWNGHNVVLPDNEAAEIYQTTDPERQSRPRNA